MNKILFSVILMFTISTKLLAGPLLLMDSYNARSFGLGSSDVSLKGDIDTFLNNPSGIASLLQISASGMYLPWYEGISSFSFSFGYPVIIKRESYGAFGLNVSTWAISPFPNYDIEGNKLPDLSASDLLFNIGYGYPLMKNFDIGLNFKFFNTELDDVNAAGFGFDLGAIVSLDFGDTSGEGGEDNLRLGLSIQNIGSAQKYIDDESSEESSLPLKMRIGTSFLVINSMDFDLTFMLEFNSTSDRESKINGGIEAGISRFLKMRLGYKASGDSDFGLSLGAGINYRISDYNLAFDYSLIPLSDLGTQHALSLKFEFGDTSGRKKLKQDIREMNKYFKERRYTRAIKKSEEILSINPLNEAVMECLDKIKKIYLKLAKYKKNKSNFKKSLVYWKRYLYLIPKDETALFEISLLTNIINDKEEPQIILNDFSETNIITIKDDADSDIADGSEEASLSYYMLSGKITENVELKIVKINDEEIEIEEKTEVQISYEIGLTKGENSIVIYAEDMKGNKVEKIVIVIYGDIETVPAEEDEPETGTE